MTEEKETPVEKGITPLPERPFLLTVICLFSFVFFGFLSLLFLLSIFYSGRITEILQKYSPEDNKSRLALTAFVVAGFLLHALSIYGTLLLWKMRRRGYMIFGIPVLIIAAYQLSQTKIFFTTTLVYVGLIILFGLFYKRMR
jgi:hypothetical protein